MAGGEFKMAKFLSLFLKILVTLPVVAILFFLTLENRGQSFSLTWSPFNEAVAVSAPIVIFAGLVIGFIWGSLILWSNTLEIRADRRALRKQVASLENQIALQRSEYDRALKMRAASAANDIVPPPTPRIASPEII